jgi:hypothetical protein
MQVPRIESSPDVEFTGKGFCSGQKLVDDHSYQGYRIIARTILLRPS